MDKYLEANPAVYQQMIEDELNMQEAMTSGLNEGSGLYTIPVVFHILHQGESIGSGSNISDAQILQALDDLNADFRNTLGLGTDVEIEFCLAQQDPDGNSQYDMFGNNVTGIRRADASGIPNFNAFGLWPGVNEVAAKALSNWPEDDYVNIWIAHRLYTGAGDAAGYAYFPSAGDDVDGIALRADATGIASNSKVITHEAGHFFTLHHTFRDGSSDCPISSSYDCSTQGDMICETRTHPQFSSFPYPCDEAQYTACDPSFSEPYLVTENHMNYTDNSCRDEFVPEQVTRMRCALVMLRGSLTSSIGCMPGCTSVVASFTVPNTTVGIGATVNFTNTSSGAQSYSWQLDGVELAQTTNWSYQFTNGGEYQVCLQAMGPDCINQFCVDISVFPSCIPSDNECELVINGDVEQVNGSLQSGFGDTGFANVCGWNAGWSTPYYCNLPNQNSFAVRVDRYRSDFTESIVSDEPLELVTGFEYFVSFDYVAANDDIENIYLLLTDDPSGRIEISDATVVANVQNTSASFIDQPNHQCYPNGTLFSSYNGIFTYNGDGRLYLVVTAVSPSVTTRSHVFFDNISLNNCGDTDCTPIPDFTYDQDCPKDFMGTNTGDGDEYTWNFLCNGISASGPSVTIDLPPGDCDVCLTVACDQETAATICQTVTVPEPSEECTSVCQDLSIPLQTCEQDLEQENSFVAQVQLTVPDGTMACVGSGILSGSSLVDIHLASMSIEDAGPSIDIITLGIDVTAAPGVDVLGGSIAGSINLCTPSGDVLCYDITFTGSACTNCLGDITATATCVDPDPTDDEYIYQGIVNITLPTLDGEDSWSECDPVSTEVGYDQSVTMNDAGNQASVAFTINTNNEGDFNAPTLLCFASEAHGQVCYTLNIDIEPCLPPDCVEWPGKVKRVKSCQLIDGQVVYDISMSNVGLFSSGYNDCGSEIRGYLEGSDEVSINTYTFFRNGSALYFSGTITMPCGFKTDQVYELILSGCNSEGSPVCFAFDIIFEYCEIKCEGVRADSRSGRSASTISQPNDIYIYPNPAQQTAILTIKDSPARQHHAVIYDHIGRKCLDMDFLQETQIDLLDFSAGIHYIWITDDRGDLIGTERLMILK